MTCESAQQKNPTTGNDVIDRFLKGSLQSGSGRVVTKDKQASAIATDIDKRKQALGRIAGG